MKPKAKKLLEHLSKISEGREYYRILFAKSESFGVRRSEETADTLSEAIDRAIELSREKDTLSVKLMFKSSKEILWYEIGSVKNGKFEALGEINMRPKSKKEWAEYKANH